MDLSLRDRLRTLVGTTAFGFVLLIAVNEWVGYREKQELKILQEHLVPKLELGPKITQGFYEVRRGLQDAVIAEDTDALERTAAQQGELLRLLDHARTLLPQTEAAALRRAAIEYYATGRAVSRRMIQGETGESIVRAVAEMQGKQLATATLVERVTHFDRADLERAFAATHRARQTGERLFFAISTIYMFLVLGLSVRMSRDLLAALEAISAGLARFAKGEFEQRVPVTTRDDMGQLAEKANEMADSLSKLAAQRDRDDWLKAGLVGLLQELRGDLAPAEAAQRALGYLSQYLNAVASALYARDGDGAFKLLATYAYSGPSSGNRAADAHQSFRPGEGLVGQAALGDGIRVVDDLPADYAKIRSGLGEARPQSVVLVPLAHHGRVTSVLELLLLGPCPSATRELLETVRETLAIALEVARSRSQLASALDESRRLTQRLKTHEEQLRENNHELTVQQEELRHANEELETQRAVLAERNEELEQAHRKLQQKAEELATVSSYKSQFLANMSHELRTPLNSMLLLSQLLAENTTGNLTDKQVEFCRTIHGAGTDLLKLINQVLDLAKIEAGRQELTIEDVPVSEFADSARRVFAPLAEDKGLSLEIHVEPGAPRSVRTDRRSVEQILVNLLGNAMKFTESGSVRLEIGWAEPNGAGARSGGDHPKRARFSVIDTGVGVAAEHRDRVFTPFEQVGGYRDKRYGSTGLGLAISRELATQLGGELTLVSEPGRGSTFSLLLPVVASPEVSVPAPVELDATPSVADDRAKLADGEPHLLAIEDDPAFADLLVEVAHDQGLKIVVAASGEEGLRLARKMRPRGILLDVRLPDIDGWTVMERLRGDLSTRAIPVHVLSAVERPERALALGAVGYLTKPAPRGELAEVIRSLSTSQRAPKVLVIEDDADGGATLVELLSTEGIEGVHVVSARAALDALAEQRFDCMILDLGLPDMDGLGLLDELEKSGSGRGPAIVVYTGRALTREEARRLEAYAQAVVYKDGRSTERLLEEIRLFVRHLRKGTPPRGMHATAPRPEGEFEGKRILLADDDMRTVYALSALLRAKGMNVLIADTGRAALDLLEQEKAVDAVLMDVMMPEMDGYEAMRRIRKEPRWQTLPVIALTAKAMKGERDRCLAAGASDYLAKPVDAERLLDVLSNWLRANHAGG